MKVSVIVTFSLAVLLAAARAEEEAATPSPTTTTPHYDDELGCWAISVEHDATYCIDGPICSGSGATPAGTLCPVKGDVAIADCHSYLDSYVGDDSCVLPVDTTCQVIKTGAWGCVLSGSSTPAPTKTCDGDCEEPTTTVTPCATKMSEPTTTTPWPTGTKTPIPTKPCPTCTEEPTKAPTPTPTGTTTPCPGCTNPPNTPTPTPTQCTANCTNPGSGSGSDYIGNSTVKVETASESSSSSGVSAGVIGAIAAAAAVVAVIAGAAIYKQYTKKLDEEETREDNRIDVVTP